MPNTERMMSVGKAIALGAADRMPGIRKIDISGVRIGDMSLDDACLRHPEVGKIVDGLKSQGKFVALAPAIAGFALLVANNPNLLGGVFDSELVQSSRERLSIIKDSIRSKIPESKDNLPS